MNIYPPGQAFDQCCGSCVKLECGSVGKVLILWSNVLASSPSGTSSTRLELFAWSCCILVRLGKVDDSESLRLEHVQDELDDNDLYTYCPNSDPPSSLHTPVTSWGWANHEIGVES